MKITPASAADVDTAVACLASPLSSGVYLETAQESNLGFYENAGFRETRRGRLGSSNLWCMFLSHERK
jgi:hypothetical protein